VTSKTKNLQVYYTLLLHGPALSLGTKIALAPKGDKLEFHAKHLIFLIGLALVEQNRIKVGIDTC
jgi:hypothetical protein